MSDFHATWVDKGNDPDFDTLRKNRIDIPFFDAREDRLTSKRDGKPYLNWVDDHEGISTCGIYAAWNWEVSWQDPVVFVEWIDKRLKEIAWKRNPPVCINIEDHDVEGYVLPALRRWRELRPLRPTWWTMEGMQGGTIEPYSVALKETHVRLAPQMYRGNMEPHRHDVTIDLLIAGFWGSELDGMYDAAALPWRWRGFAFTMGRLPR